MNVQKIEKTIEAIIDISNSSNNNLIEEGNDSSIKYAEELDSSYIYFDELQGGPNLKQSPTKIPPLVNYWRKELIDESDLDGKFNACYDSAMQLLCFYNKFSKTITQTKLKAMLKKIDDKNSTMERNHAWMEGILRYEMLIGLLISESSLHLNLSSNKMKTNIDHKQINKLKTEMDIDGIFSSVQRLSDDISETVKFVINMYNRNNGSRNRDIDVAEKLMSILIRFLLHNVDLLSTYLHLQMIGYISDANNIEWKVSEILACATLVALSFLSCDQTSYNKSPDFSTSAPNSINAFDLIPDLISQKISLSFLIQSCALPPNQNTMKKYKSDMLTQILNSNSNIELIKTEHVYKSKKQNKALFNIQTLPAKVAVWSTSGVVRRVAYRLLESIDVCVSNLCRVKSNISKINPLGEEKQIHSKMTIPDRITNTLGQECISRSCRRLFFNKSTLSNSRRKVQIKSETNYCPSHVHSTLMLIKSLSSTLVSDVLNDLLSISYTLLDHHDIFYQHIGAAFLLWILHRAIPNDLYRHWHNIERISYDVWKTGCRDKMWNLTLLLLARSEMMSILKDYDTTNAGKLVNWQTPSTSSVTIAVKRREFSRELFVKLKKQIYTRKRRGYFDTDDEINFDDEDAVVDVEEKNKYVDEDLITPILLVGICPHLSQHAEMGRRNGTRQRISDAMEISTDGLSALLLLLQSLDWEVGHMNFNDESIWILPIATVTALISLFMSTYPALKRRGGEIMCTLLSSLGNCNKNIESRHQHTSSNDRSSQYVNVFMTMTLHAASVALVSCGKQAENMLTEVEANCIDSLVCFCKEIRSGAKILISNEK